MSADLKITLVNCEAQLLTEIGQKEMKRKDVALTYALALCSGEKIDWAKVNTAIIKRWSVAALKWIKEQAWKRIEEKRKAVRA